MSDPVVLLSTGDVVGPAGGVTDNSMVLFSGTSGKLIKGNNAVVTAAGLALLDDVDAAAQRTTLQLKTGAVTNKTTFNTDPTVGSLIKVGDFGVGGMLDLRGTIFVTGKPQDLYSKGFVKGFADGGPAGLAIPGIVSISYGVLELNAHWTESSGAGGIMRSFTQGHSGIVYTQTMANATTWGPWIATWNTSNLVKTTSATDTTAGSMLKVGDFGLGAVGATPALANIDYHYLATGLYWFANGAGTPPDVYGYVLVQRANAAVSMQTFTDTSATQQWLRYSNGSVWSAWKKIALTDSPAFTGIPTAPTAASGTNTQQLASTAFVQAAVGVGNVSSFATATPPTGWLKANGAAINRATYAALFTAIGTTFGAGDGSTTFNVPDLRGEFVRGWDDGRGLDTGRVFGSAQLDQFENHTHYSTASGWVTNGGNASGGAGVASGNAGAYSVASGKYGAETRPRNVALLYCIKY